MLYCVTGQHREPFMWHPWCRLYLRSLALAGEPFRVLFQGETVDVTALPPSIACLREHVGPRHDQKASAMLLCGTPLEAIERIRFRDECPRYNVALTVWPADEVPAHIAIGLNRYDAVIVPETQVAVFERSKVANVYGVPWPAATAEELAVQTIAKPDEVRTLACTVGFWDEGAKALVQAFTQRFRWTDGVGLVVGCLDQPLGTVEQLHGERTPDEMPFVTFVRAPGSLGSNPAAIDRLLRSADCYVDCTRWATRSLWAQRAASLGVRVVDGPDALEAYQGGLRWPGVTGAQRWRALGELDEMLDGIEQHDGETHAAATYAAPDHAGHELHRIIEEAKTRAPGTQRSAPGANSPALTAVPFKLSLGVVVPFMETAIELLEDLDKCLSALAEQVAEGIHLVVSVQGDSPGARALCKKYGVAYCRVATNHDGWSIATTRNAGVRYLIEQVDDDLDLVTFVDADITIPDGYFDRLIHEAYRHPGRVMTPVVIDEGGARTRPGSGMSCFPVDAFVEALGYEESFVGWGYEDLDLLMRLRDLHDVETVLLTQTSPCLHRPHGPRDEHQEADDKANLECYEARCAKVDAGETIETNPDGWGHYRTE